MYKHPAPPQVHRTPTARMWLLFLAAVSALSGCTSTGQLWLKTAQAALHGGSNASEPTNPKYQYLRCIINGRTLFLAKGFTDETASGPIETWYSGGGEVIKLLNGRIVGTAGITPEWRNVRYSNAPSWDVMAAASPGPSSMSYTRTRDVMPGYLYGIQDEVQVIRLASSTPENMGSVVVEERMTSTAQPLPAALYRLQQQDGHWRVVASKQCLSERFCLTLEQWAPPPVPTK